MKVFASFLKIKIFEPKIEPIYITVTLPMNQDEENEVVFGQEIISNNLLERHIKTVAQYNVYYENSPVRGKV